MISQQAVFSHCTGGILLAVYTMSIWPIMLDRVTTCPPVSTLLVAAFVWLIEMLFSVWTVAYNFVPGGVYTREHTGWLITAVMVTLGLATLLGICSRYHSSMVLSVLHCANDVTWRMDGFHSCGIITHDRVFKSTTVTVESGNHKPHFMQIHPQS